MSKGLSIMKLMIMSVSFKTMYIVKTSSAERKL